LSQRLWKSDESIFARLAPGNETILDYFCVPASKEERAQITLLPQSPVPRDIQQFTDLDFLEDFARWGRRLGDGCRSFPLKGMMVLHPDVSQASNSAFTDCEAQQDRLRCPKVAVSQLLH
jgi:hypothetical protein